MGGAPVVLTIPVQTLFMSFAYLCGSRAQLCYMLEDVPKHEDSESSVLLATGNCFLCALQAPSTTLLIHISCLPVSACPTLLNLLTPRRLGPAE